MTSLNYTVSLKGVGCLRIAQTIVSFVPKEHLAVSPFKPLFRFFFPLLLLFFPAIYYHGKLLSIDVALEHHGLIWRICRVKNSNRNPDLHHHHHLLQQHSKKRNTRFNSNSNSNSSPTCKSHSNKTKMAILMNHLLLRRCLMLIQTRQWPKPSLNQSTLLWTIVSKSFVMSKAHLCCYDSKPRLTLYFFA